MNPGLSGALAPLSNSRNLGAETLPDLLSSHPQAFDRARPPQLSSVEKPDAKARLLRFFERPILNSPYEQPLQHWELDEDGQPTNRIMEMRRRSDHITPVPKPKKRRQAKADQSQMLFGEHSTEEQEYNPTPIINEVRTYVETWRNLPNPDQWLVTPETTRSPEAVKE